MARGGYRKGAGRKSSWASGCSKEETKPIRVPITIADKVLSIFHQLDEGKEIKIDNDTQSIKLENQGLKGKIKELEGKIQQSTLNKAIQSYNVAQQKKQTLSILKVGNQASLYKKASFVLDKFIESLDFFSLSEKSRFIFS